MHQLKYDNKNTALTGIQKITESHGSSFLGGLFCLWGLFIYNYERFKIIY